MVQYLRWDCREKCCAVQKRGKVLVLHYLEAMADFSREGGGVQKVKQVFGVCCFVRWEISLCISTKRTVRLAKFRHVSRKRLRDTVAAT